MTLGIRKAGASGAPQLVTLRPPGLAERVPRRSLLLSAIACGFFAIVLLLPFARTPRLLSALARDRGLRRVRFSILETGVMLAAVAATAVALRLAPGEANLAAAFLTTTFAALAAGFFARRGSALSAATSQLPGAIAIGAVVATTGSLRLSDLAALQGARPWEWTLARVPPTALLLGAWALSGRQARRRGRADARAIHLASFAVLGSVMFLGGAIATDNPRPLAIVVSTFAVLTMKAFALVGLIARAAPRRAPWPHRAAGPRRARRLHRVRVVDVRDQRTRARAGRTGDLRARGDGAPRGRDGDNLTPHRHGAARGSALLSERSERSERRERRPSGSEGQRDDGGVDLVPLLKPVESRPLRS